MEMVEQKVKHQDEQNWDRHAGVCGLMFALTAVRAIFIISPARVSGFAYLLPDSQFLPFLNYASYASYVDYAYSVHSSFQRKPKHRQKLLRKRL